LVVWDHLAGYWFLYVDSNYWPMKQLVKYVNGPLAITEHFGFFGVALFFLISGFIITHVAQREDRLTFAVKRLFRIYPPMILMVLIAPTLEALSFQFFGAPTPGAKITARDQFWSATLLNYFIGKPAVCLVTWSLAIELLFYSLCLVTLPLLQRRPRVAMAIELAVVWLLCSARLNVANSFGFMWFMSFVPCLLFGQIVYFLWSGRIHFRDYAIFSLAAYFVFIRGRLAFQPERLAPQDSQVISLAYAYGAFLIAMLVSEKIRLPSVLAGVSEISYSLYLWHIAIGRFVIAALINVAFPLALTAALIAVLVVSYVSWRFVERPSQMLARQLLAWWRPPTPRSVQPSAPVASMPVRAAA
jgi:peptidoglycan/LPS O-acetylase OafA/YrhL